MKQISNEEENLMYNILSESLLKLCETKPSNCIEFLSNTLLAEIGEVSDDLKKSKKIPIHNIKLGIKEETNVIKEEKLVLKSFKDQYTLSKKLPYGNGIICYENNIPGKFNMIED